MKWDSYLKSAISVIDGYDGAIPLSGFLKKFFYLHKQMGSRDRKAVSALVYNYYRLGHALREVPREERIFSGVFLCESSPSEFLQHFKPGWNEQIRLPADGKIPVLRQTFPSFHLPDIFPWKEELSEGIDHEKFCLSFLRQPELFIRTRLDKREQVAALLQHAGIGFEITGATGIALPNGTPVEKIIPDRSWYVVQDGSSQQMADYLKFLVPGFPFEVAGDQTAEQGYQARNPKPEIRSPKLYWDCCAGSGGKSILLHDLYPQAKLFVTDIRRSILKNLDKRFSDAGITDYRSAVKDVTKPEEISIIANKISGAGELAGIIADVPCSGSGTWSRTPEQLCFFDPGEISRFSHLQRTIISGITRLAGRGIPVVYITCSVFKKENEAATDYLREQLGFHVEKSGITGGYEKKADSLYAACLIKQ